MSFLSRAAIGLGLASTALAQVPVDVRLVDQSGVEISGSYIQVGPIAHPTGSVLDLAEGNVTFSLQPALPAQSGTGRIARTEVVEITSATTALEFEWIMETVALNLRDQYGVLLPNSALQVYPGGSLALPNGGSVRLPVNDASTYPTLYSATWPSGYGVILDATPGGSFGKLTRLDSGVVVSPGTTQLDFEWKTSAVELRVVDQDDVLIPEAYLQPYPSGPSTTNGGTLVLPVTDQSVYPTINPLTWGDGYDVLVDVTPGVNTSQLVRVDGQLQVLESTSLLEFEWIRVHCPLSLLDAELNPVLGSTIQFPNGFPPFAIGDTITLPITDNSIYPTIGSTYNNGYPITITPGDQVGESLSVQLEVLVDGQLDPDTVGINGSTYHLSCANNQPPSADAGPNLSIASSEQSITVIQGMVSDVDGDLLTYRWLEGPTELLGTTTAGSAGEAPIDLGLVASLGLGEHELTLEVFDGTDVSTDSMILTIGNSSPEVGCSGAGSYEWGVDDVVLGGTLADFDGDLVSYEWTLGGTSLASGVVQTIAGGTPVILPTASIATGPSAGEVPYGQSSIVLTVIDASGASSQCSVEVVVVDTEAPTLAPVSDVAILWPPNHQMVTVTIDPNASDSSGQPVTITAVVQSSENAGKNGSGHTEPDFTEPVIDPLTGQIQLQLRAERSGKGQGRVYTIVITATDAAGTSSVAEIEVIAPHDKRGA